MGKGRKVVASRPYSDNPSGESCPISSARERDDYFLPCLRPLFFLLASKRFMEVSFHRLQRVQKHRRPAPYAFFGGTKGGSRKRRAVWLTTVRWSHPESRYE